MAELNMTFIGSLDEADPKYGAVCRHGESEVTPKNSADGVVLRKHPRAMREEDVQGHFLRLHPLPQQGRQEHWNIGSTPDQLPGGFEYFPGPLPFLRPREWQGAAHEQCFLFGCDEHKVRCILVKTNGKEPAVPSSSTRGTSVSATGPGRAARMATPKTTSSVRSRSRTTETRVCLRGHAC